VNSAQRDLVLAQLVFWASVLLCLAVTGGGLGDNHGFSVYGGKWTTILPWAVGIAAAAALVSRAADALAGDPPLARCLRVNVVLLVFILLTPDSIDQFFYVAHIVASVALFLFQALVGLWLVVARPRSHLVLQLYVVQIAAGLVAGASQAQWIGLLSPGILVFQLAFGAVLYAVTSSRSARSAARSKPFGARSPSRKSRERMQ
jgi:hypothetical protein